MPDLSCNFNTNLHRCLPLTPCAPCQRLSAACANHLLRPSLCPVTWSEGAVDENGAEASEWKSKQEGSGGGGGGENVRVASDAAK